MIEILRPADTDSFLLNGERVQYQRGTREHKAFLKLLREGMPKDEEAQRQVKLAVDLPEWKAMSLADDVGGGYLASPEFAADLLRLLVNASPIRRVARVVPMAANLLLQPVRAGIQTAKRVSEVGARTSYSDAAFRLLNIPAPEMYATTVASRVLVMDSHYPLDSELLDAASRAFALQEGTEAIKGSGVGEMLGLNQTTLPAGNVVTATGTGSTIAEADVYKLALETLPAAYLPGAAFLMNAKTFSKIRQLRGTSTSGPYLFEMNDSPSTLLGFPITIMPDLDDVGTTGNTVAYFGNFQLGYSVVDRQQVIVQRLAERLAESGQIEFIIWQRVGGQVTMPEAIARLNVA